MGSTGHHFQVIEIDGHCVISSETTKIDGFIILDVIRKLSNLIGIAEEPLVGF